MLALVLCVAYALGCISPGWWLVRRTTGVDLRTTGSGATGATNAARVLGGKAFALVMTLDAVKAGIAILFARAVLQDPTWHSLAMPAVVVGHIWPATLRFRGGRGAAPLLGGSVALNPWFLAAAAVPAALVACFKRRTFAITSAAAAGGIACAWWLLPSLPDRIAFGISVAFVVIAHRSHFVKTSPSPVP